MKNVIIILTVITIFLILVNVQPTVVGNAVKVVDYNDITGNLQICQHKWTTNWKCTQGKYLQRELLNPDCTTEWKTKVLCNGVCVEPEGEKPYCKKVYEEPPFIQGSWPYGPKPHAAIDFSIGEYKPNPSRYTDIFIKRSFDDITIKGGASVPLKIVNKRFDEVTYDDCAEGLEHANPRMTSFQSACITTQEGNIGVIGGYWVGRLRKHDILHWRYYDLS